MVNLRQFVVDRKEASITELSLCENLIKPTRNGSYREQLESSGWISHIHQTFPKQMEQRTTVTEPDENRILAEMTDPATIFGASLR